MSSEEDEKMKAFIEELESVSADEEYTKDEGYKELPPISEDDFEYKLMSGVAMLLDSCNEVAHNLKNRIKSGDNYEGTMMGFAQATDNTLKALKVLETRRNIRIKAELKKEELGIQQKNRLEIEDKKNEGKAMSNVKNLTQNNTFVGSPMDFFDKMKKLESGEIIEEVKNDDDQTLDV